MSVLKCKMCGGDLQIEENSSICTCIYCKTKQTVPNTENEKKNNLFNRANKLRNDCEFDKAYGIYESIISEYSNEAEAYWGLVLCTYGIEYVIDPKSNKRIPTCHRSSFTSVLDDENFKLTLEYSDTESEKLYKEEAKEIDRLNKIIIEMSYKEEDYDIFICYKESDNDNNRTIDSLIAEDIYKELTKRNYRVFFSRVSLEDKLGSLYEPYIFSALNSAKIMLVVGTSEENFNAVWVKNEWSRFLSLIKKGERKTLIPCYKNMSIYDMPKEFLRLQSQDMNKVGSMEDLMRGIEKIISNTNSNQNLKEEYSEETLTKDEKYENENFQTNIKKKSPSSIIIVTIIVVTIILGIIISNVISSNNSDNNSVSSEIKKERGKVNIYLFYQDTCSHCEAEIAYFDKIKNTYGSYFNLYTFNISNEENYELMKSFVSYTNTELLGVPFTVIGSTVLQGFSDDVKENLVSVIIEESQKNYDVYLDEIIEQ